MSTDNERSEESACLDKLRARARRLMAANPALSRDASFAQACAQMPNTANRYLHVVAVLGTQGRMALPLWE
jgi:hypothetical protein